MSTGLACKLLEGVDGSLRGLADLDDVAVRITHVTAQFVAVIIEGLGEKPSAFLGPLFIACVNVCDAQIEEAAHAIRIIWWREPYVRLVRRRTSAGVEDDPGILQLDVAGIFLLHDVSAQDADVKFLGLCLVCSCEILPTNNSLLRFRY